MSNSRTKQLASFSIDKKVLEDFRTKAKSKKINMSRWVEEKMREYLSK